MQILLYTCVWWNGRRGTIKNSFFSTNKLFIRSEKYSTLILIDNSKLIKHINDQSIKKYQ